MTWHHLPRRAVLLGGLAGLGAALGGCASAPPPTGTSPAPQPSMPSAEATAEAELARLEMRFGGRLGVYAVDSGTGATVGHRTDERFLMTSTFKMLAVSAILRLRERQPGLLDRVIHYDRSQLLPYSPLTSRHVDDGMTVSALCQAAITQSDNTAANLLLQILGGPRAVTAFTRTLGDPLTRLDRIEPDVNVGAPGDQRDTSTPAQMAGDLRALALGTALDTAGRDLLVDWLKASTTGNTSIRAGLPAGWQTGDKTGSGTRGEVNDIAVVWPSHHAPLVIAIYTAPTDPKSTAGYATVASAATIVVEALVPAV